MGKYTNAMGAITFNEYKKLQLNPYQPSVAFHIETSYLICIANQMAGFNMKCNTELKWVNVTQKFSHNATPLKLTMLFKSPNDDYKVKLIFFVDSLKETCPVSKVL